MKQCITLLKLGILTLLWIYAKLVRLRYSRVVVFVSLYSAPFSNNDNVSQRNQIFPFDLLSVGLHKVFESKIWKISGVGWNLHTWTTCLQAARVQLSRNYKLLLLDDFTFRLADELTCDNVREIATLVCFNYAIITTF